MPQENSGNLSMDDGEFSVIKDKAEAQAFQSVLLILNTYP